MKPFVNTYFNENDELVLVYQSEITIGDEREPEWLLIKNADHLEEIVKALNEVVKVF